MKIREMFGPRSLFAGARSRFERIWRVKTNPQLRIGPRSVAWRIDVDVSAFRSIPPNAVLNFGSVIAAGGVCDTPDEAAQAIARHYLIWTVTGPSGMTLAGRAGW